MPVPPTVSLIVLNWNGRHHLEACLTSLLALNHPADKLQVILLDNGSTDGSVEFVRTRFPQVRLIELPENVGFAAGNNLAAEHATGEWLGLVNNDMRMEPDWLSNLLRGLEDCPGAACLASKVISWDGGRIDFVGGGLNVFGHGFHIDFGEASSDSDVARRVLFANGGAMLVRRDVFEQVGGFDASYFAYFEDVDLGWRLNLLGHDVWYTPRAVVRHRHHSTGRKLEPHRLRVLYERNALMTIYKCLDDADLAMVLPAALMLLNERALDIGELDRSEFHLGPEAPPSAPSGRRGPAYAFDPAASARESTGQKARRILRQEGVGMLFVKGLRRVRWEARKGLLRVIARMFRELNLPGLGPAFRIGLAHYVAVSEFANRIPELTEKRAALQAGRKRSDDELLPMFVDPLWSSYTDPRYLEFYGRLCRSLGLDARFGAGPLNAERLA